LLRWPRILNALSGRGVHVVTVNDYSRTRCRVDGQALQLPGVVVGHQPVADGTRAEAGAYAADITYGTNNEFGFDYLRDNMVYETHARVQRR